MIDNKHVMVSVIIPCYNIEKWIGETLQSIMKQTNQNFEVICVNDGSTDETLKVLERYANDYDKVKVLSQVNAGVSMARNNGIRHAKGKYISFLDGDDLLHPDFIKDMLSLAESKGWPDLINAGYCNLSDDSFDKVSESEYPLSVFGSRDEFIQNYDKLDYYVNSIGSKLYKRELIVDNLIQYDVNIKNMEDMAFNLDYFSVVNTCVIHNVPYYNYRIRENSAIHRMTPPKYIERTYEHQISFLNHIGEGNADFLLNNSKVFRYYFWRHSIMYKTLYIVSESKNIYKAKMALTAFFAKEHSAKVAIENLEGRNGVDKVLLYLLRHTHYLSFAIFAQLKYLLSRNTKLFNFFKKLMNK